MSQAISQAVAETFAELGEAARRERVEAYRLGKTAEFIEQRAGGYAGKRVLELGSSLGINLLIAKRLGAARVAGVDKFVFPEAGDNAFSLPPEHLTSLRSAWAKHDLEVKGHDLAEPLPFADGSFDLVVCNAVIEHLHGIHRTVFLEAARVLAPGGHFVFTTPNIASLLKRVRMIVGRSPLWDLRDYFDSGLGFTGHVREFTVKECREMYAWSGFTPVSVVAAPGYFKWRWLRMPKKWHMFAFQSISFLWSTWGDLIYASGRKK